MSAPLVPGPLDGVGSIKLKLGALVAVSVLVAVAMVSLGELGGVPWWLTAPVSVGLALAVTQVLARGMVAPLTQMADVASRMSAGDLSGRVHSTAADEVGQLARAFNRMAADLSRVDAERRDLIAVVSHELRTPLAAMTAVLENLADGVVPSDGPHLAVALERAERLRDLVEDLLALSRLEAGAVELATEQVDLPDLVEACGREVEAGGRTTEVRHELRPDLRVAADPRRLRQLLVNLLDNATRHAPVGTPVLVRGDVAGSGEWWLEVVDHGPGVPADRREAVFERFGTDAGGGTGLGLAISRWVARLHGGTLVLAEPADGEGAVLRLDVPPTTPGPLTADERAVAARATSTPGPGTSAVTAPPATSTRVTSAAPHEAPRAAPQTGPSVPSGPVPAGILGSFWPEPPGLSSTRPVLATAGVGLLAALVLGFEGPGLSWGLVLAAAGAVAWWFARDRFHPFTLACTALAALLVLPTFLLEGEGYAILGILGAAAVFLCGLTGVRNVVAVYLSGMAWVLAPFRGFAWFVPVLRRPGRSAHAAAWGRTLLFLALGLLVFGTLLISADPVLGTWLGHLVPDVTLGTGVARIFVGCAVFGLTLAGVYVGVNPPLVNSDAGPHGKPLRRFEWLVPVLGVVTVFALFILAQAAALFGGHDYVARTAGLTYADYVHQGFGQMVVASVLTLVVFWAASRRASADDRGWLLGSLGALGVLALLVVVSALLRMAAYADAYGFTVLRLNVAVFEGWVGFLLLAVLVLGALRRGRWLARVGVLSGAATLAGLLLLNPAGWVAGHNIDRAERTGTVDAFYLSELGLDASGAVAARWGDDVARCLASGSRTGTTWREWNLATFRAERRLGPLGQRWQEPATCLPAGTVDSSEVQVYGP